IVRRLPARAAAPSPERESAAPAAPARRRRLGRGLGKVAVNILFVAMVACVGLMLGATVLGFHRYVILTGSMTGTYDRGSLVFDRPVPVSQLKVGDPITYDPPPGFTSQTRVTHRIFSIRHGVDGKRVFKTKGDANLHPDIWTFTLSQPTQDEVAFHVPEVGYLFMMLSIKKFRLFLVGVPALIIGLILFRALWREGGDEVKRQRLAEQGWRALTDPRSDAVLQPIDAPAEVRLPVSLDLRLRPGRAGRGTRGQAQVADRPPLDLSLPLRVGRLTSAGGRITVHPPGPPITRQRRGATASIATKRLLVSREVSRV
ncbi:MAG: signal peptidase I, partial [Solirubrobacteraceae bacterium]